MSIKAVNLKELYQKDIKLDKSDVKAILEWAEKQSHLPQVTELQAVLFLQSCYYSIEQAKTALDNFFTIRTLCPHLFGNRDPNEHPDEYKDVGLRSGLVAILPTLSSEGDTIVYTKLIDLNPDIYNPTLGSKMFDMIVMAHLNQHGPTEGLTVIFDMAGSVFGHLTKMNLTNTKQFLQYLQIAMPVRLKMVHFINVVPFMDKLMTIVKPFMKKELFDKIVIHAESNETLYKYIAKESLPQELGGQCESCDILYEKMKSALYANADFFKFEESQTVDESRRTGPAKNESNLFGTDGSFKKINID